MFFAIHEEITNLLKSVGVAEPTGLTSPPKAEMGDIAFPCFGLAKEQKTSPAAVATALAEKISSHKLPKLIERVQAFGPYVNFFLSTAETTNEIVATVLKQEQLFGTSQSGEGKKVLIEYPSNNTHKEFHIGHFRNVCIGNTLVALYRASGYETHPVNYLNDFGAHVARCLWGLVRLHRGETPPENKQKWLGEIYAEASRYVKEHPEAAAEVGEMQQKLEAHDPAVTKLFMETRAWSIEKFEELFTELGVEHETTFYEKDIKGAGHTIVDELLKKGIAEVGERGAIIIDLKKYNLDIALVRKADGTGLYLTSDLPLAEEKFKRFPVDESIVITGQEQVFYFKQLYKILELIGFKKKLTHISYGLVTRPEGKMSSRLGNVILYEDLRDEVYAKMYSETKSRHDAWSETQVVATAHALTNAALKFDMQKHEAAKNIVFDINEATSVEGFSGPYILYVVARINSLLRKGGSVSGGEEAMFSEPAEKKLALLMGEYADIVSKALIAYNPSSIARYCFDLAQAFNDFYSTCPVLEGPQRASRLRLCLAVKQVLTNALRTLSIGVVEEM